MKKLFLLGLIGIASTAMAGPVFTLGSVKTSGSGQNAFAAVESAGGRKGDFAGSTADKLVFNHGVTDTAGQDYFVIRLPEPVVLEQPGDSVTLQFSAIATRLRTMKGTEQAFRFGLFDIGQSTDGSAQGGFAKARGYRASYGRADSALGIYKRHSGKNSNLWTAAGRLRDPNNTAPVENFAATFAATDILGASLTIERVDAKSVRITATGLGNDEESEVTDAAGLTRFNAISFFLWKGSTAPASFTLADLQVTVNRAGAK